MSGIAAVVNFDGAPAPRQVLEQMTCRIAYRGVDGVRYWYGDGVGLAHLALNSTPEALHETQPLHSNDRRLVLVADARIDNRPELLGDLKSELPRTEVTTDADLILAAYQKWGTGCPDRLIGDFAFVLWDTRERQLFAARDPLGVRSLSFARFGDTVVVASEAQQILEHPAASGRLNEVALAGWVVGRPDHHACLFEGIEPLPPGYYLMAGGAGVKRERYWSIDFEASTRYPRLEDYEKHLIELLTRSVSDRLRTNAPVIGSELSGGMDSTSITALAHRCLQGRSTRLVACTQQFNTIKQCDETEYAQAVIDHLGIEALFIDAEQQGALGYPEMHPPSRESPSIFHDPATAFELQQLRSAGARVVLTGNGGDEVAAGSELVYLHRLLRGDLSVLREIAKHCGDQKQPLLRTLYALMVRPVIPTSVHRVLRRLGGRKRADPHPWPLWVRREAAERLELRKRFFTPDRKPLWTAAQRDLNEYLTAGSLPAVLGTYDLTAGACGMEARHPFLDRRIVEFALALPQTLWVSGVYGKWLLRRATRGLLPDKVRWRVDKTRFGAV